MASKVMYNQTFRYDVTFWGCPELRFWEPSLGKFTQHPLMGRPYLLPVSSGVLPMPTPSTVFPDVLEAEEEEKDGQKEIQTSSVKRKTGRDRVQWKRQESWNGGRASLLLAHLSISCLFN